jgi:hypothetical protein
MRFALAALSLGLTGCVSTVPIVLSGSYTLPGGKGIVQIAIPINRHPPTNQK